MTTRLKRLSDNPASTSAATLSTPCTLQALRQWLTNLDELTTGPEHASATVTTTSSTIAVS